MSKYSYFVAFGFDGGAGNYVINMPNPIRSHNDITEIEAWLHKNVVTRTKVVKVNNFQMLSGPGACRSCGK